MSDVNLIVIRKTQDLLGKYVKKPALSEKLLKKPPFRFLHDVINVVIQETGYLNDVYSEDELNIENVKDKEAKIAFLQKLIDAVKVTSTVNLKVRPSKIVAGLEPERTNELLQAIGKAVEAQQNATAPTHIEPPPAKASNTKSVPSPRTKPGSKAASNPTIAPKKSPATTKAAAPKVKTTRDTNKSVDTKGKVSSKIVKTKAGTKDEGVKTTRTKKVEKPEKVVTNKEPIEVTPILETTNELIKDDPFGEETDIPSNIVQNNESSLAPVIENIAEPITEPKPEDLTPSLSEQTTQNVDTSIPSESSEIPQQPKLANSDLIDVIDQEAEIRRRERSSRKHHKSSDNKNATEPPAESMITEPEPLPSATTKSHRQKSSSTKISSANRPLREEFKEDLQQIIKVKDEPVPMPQIRPRTSLRPPSVRPASARPGAPRRRDRNVEIFLQPDEAAQMAGIQVKVDSFASIDLDDDGDNLIVIEDPTIVADALNGPNVEISSEKDGELAGEQHGHLVQQILKTQKEFSKPDDVDEDVDKDFSMKRQRQSSAKQMDTLRDSIQMLTRSVNPLGKLMDFLQEDIDSMEMELAAWRRSYNSTKTDLKREISLNETAVQPLKNQLAQIEVTIAEHIELIHTSRLNILQNEDKIFKMLSEI